MASVTFLTCMCTGFGVLDQAADAVAGKGSGGGQRSGDAEGGGEACINEGLAGHVLVPFLSRQSWCCGDSRIARLTGA
jgi:hypothetical protein